MNMILRWCHGLSSLIVWHHGCFREQPDGEGWQLHVRMCPWPLSEYNPAYQTPHFSDALCIRLCMLCNSTPPPASVPLHVPPPLICLFVCLPLSLVHMLLVCLFVSPSGLFLLIDGQWTSTKSNCTHSIRRGLGRRLRSSLLLNSSPRCNLPCRIVY